ncbi:phage holin family protein [Aerococcaceae bacterium NML160702]|nr:phage holin family protein [Aerococcaceae bacterium NML160702]
MKKGEFLGNMFDFSLISKISGGIGVAVSLLFGEWHQMFTVLLVVQLLDIISGFLRAMTNKDLSSSEMTKGLFKKFAVWIVIILAHMIDLVLFDHAVLQVGVAFAYVASEGLSITENLGAMGVLVPDEVVEHLKQVQGKK